MAYGQSYLGSNLVATDSSKPVKTSAAVVDCGRGSSVI